MLVDSVSTVATLESKELGQLWARLKEIKQAYGMVEEAIKGAALREPIPLPDGSWLTQIEVKGRTSLDEKKVHEALKGAGWTDEQYKTLFKKGDPFTMTKEVKKKP